MQGRVFRQANFCLEKRCAPLQRVSQRCSATQTEQKSTEKKIAEEAQNKWTVRKYHLQQTPEERAAERKPLLTEAESSLAEYCSSLPGEGEESEQCWLAYDYFERRKDDAESGCHVDWSSKAREGPDCAKLDSFESFVRQLLGASPMSSFAHLLYTLRKSELHKAQEASTEEEEPAIVEVAEKGGGSHFELTNVPESGKDRLIALFWAMDTNSDGRLDAAEFREAMEKLGMGQLTGPTVGTIFQAMDIHGPITLEEFLHIVEAEQINADTPMTRWLRLHKSENNPFWGQPIESI